MNKKVGIVFYEGWIGVSPTLMSLISWHIKKNDFIELFIRDDNEYDLSVLDTFDKERFQVVKIATTQRFIFLETVYKVADRIHSLNILDKAILRIKKNISVRERFKRMLSFSKGMSSGTMQFDYFIAVDSTGLFCLKYSNIKLKNLIYLSLELLRLNKLSDWLEKKISINEGKLLKKRVDLILIQNKERWNFLKEYHELKEKKISFLPNSCFDDGDDKSVKGYFFHNHLHLDRQTIIVASAGMIHPSVLSLEIAEAVCAFRFQRPLKVVFHDRMPGNNNDYINSIRAAGGSNLLISDFPLPYSEISKVFSSIDIGLAIYAPSEDPNFHLIGAASGKLFQYMKYGVPVIANRLPGLAEIVEDNDIGIVIDDISELEHAVKQVLSNYSRLSKNAGIAFKSKYQMGLLLDEYYTTITNLSSN